MRQGARGHEVHIELATQTMLAVLAATAGYVVPSLPRRTPPPTAAPCACTVAMRTEDVTQIKKDEKPDLAGSSEPDLTSSSETYAAICRICGAPNESDAVVKFDSFVRSFEELFNRGVPLDSEALDELRAAVKSEDHEDVSADDWSAFHRTWLESSSMGAHLASKAEQKRTAAQAKEAWQDLAARAEKREQEFTKALTEAKREKASAKPKLLANNVAKATASQYTASAAAAQYRSLDPEDWSAVTGQVGGLSEALEEIRRRIWTPLCAPRALLDELGATRVKGLLLHGPPGCGKSYLAARLAAGLSRRAPTVVSGPEIMNKYVGSSEEQLREIFTKPPMVPARKGDTMVAEAVAEANELHVIVLDEFDAIARQRSDASKDTATRDSVVNQLLALMDGVAQLPVPTFVLALTNRRELVDSAVLRPGRLEVHVEVGRPGATGRGAILRIHAEKMRESGRLALDGASGDGGGASDECSLERVDDAAYDSWVSAIAAQTDGFSGAAMAAVVRAAVARALDRSVSSSDVQGCRVTDDDFSKAVDDVRRSSLGLREGLGEELLADGEAAGYKQTS